MADLPTNALVRIAEEDTTLPIAGSANKIPPEVPLTTVGYDKNNSYFAQNFNYIFDNLAQYIQYLVESIEENDTTIADLQAQITANADTIATLVPSVGDLYHTESTVTPAVKFGVGTWELIEESFLVGYQSGDPDFGTIGGTGGARSHLHTFSSSSPTDPAGAETLTINRDGWGADGVPPDATTPKTLGRILVGSGNVELEETLESINGANNDITVDTTNHTHNVSVSGNTGSSSNLPPYRVVYIWKRTA